VRIVSARWVWECLQLVHEHPSEVLTPGALAQLVSTTWVLTWTSGSFGMRLDTSERYVAKLSICESTAGAGDHAETPKEHRGAK
jgi:hypothetical protein